MKRPILKVEGRLDNRAKTATIVNIDGNKVDLWTHGSSNVYKNVEVLGGTPAEYLAVNQLVSIIWIKNRPVVISEDMTLAQSPVYSNTQTTSLSTKIFGGMNQAYDHVFNEVYYGVTSKVIFPIKKTFVFQTTAVYVSGQRQELDVDYTEDQTTNEIVFATAPNDGAVIIIDYITDGNSPA